MSQTNRERVDKASKKKRSVKVSVKELLEVQPLGEGKRRGRHTQPLPSSGYKLVLPPLALQLQTKVIRKINKQLAQVRSFELALALTHCSRQQLRDFINEQHSSISEAFDAFYEGFCKFLQEMKSSRLELFANQVEPTLNRNISRRAEFQLHRHYCLISQIQQQIKLFQEKKQFPLFITLPQTKQIMLAIEDQVQEKAKNVHPSCIHSFEAVVQKERLSTQYQLQTQKRDVRNQIKGLFTSLREIVQFQKAHQKSRRIERITQKSLNEQSINKKWGLSPLLFRPEHLFVEA